MAKRSHLTLIQGGLSMDAPKAGLLSEAFGASLISYDPLIDYSALITGEREPLPAPFFLNEDVIKFDC